MSNPFERLDLDPMQGTAAITERLRELMEEASEAERDALRAVWEELTLHPRRRLLVALQTFPETRAPLGSPPRETRPEAVVPVEPRLRDLVVVPRVAMALGPPPTEAPAVLPPVERDPWIGAPNPPKTK